MCNDDHPLQTHLHAKLVDGDDFGGKDDDATVSLLSFAVKLILGMMAGS